MIELHRDDLYRPPVDLIQANYLSRFFNWPARRSRAKAKIFMARALSADENEFRQRLKGHNTDCAVLDPMMGGGTFPCLAAEMGCRAIGVDLYPLPFLAMSALMNFVDNSDRFFEWARSINNHDNFPYYTYNNNYAEGLIYNRFLIYKNRKYPFYDAKLGKGLFLCPWCGSVRPDDYCDGCHRSLDTIDKNAKIIQKKYNIGHYSIAIYPALGVFKRGGKLDLVRYEDLEKPRVEKPGRLLDLTQVAIPAQSQLESSGVSNFSDIYSDLTIQNLESLAELSTDIMGLWTLIYALRSWRLGRGLKKINNGNIGMATWNRAQFWTPGVCYELNPVKDLDLFINRLVEVRRELPEDLHGKNATFYCHDSTDLSFLDEKVDLVMTDPPYSDVFSYGDYSSLAIEAARPLAKSLSIDIGEHQQDREASKQGGNYEDLLAGVFGEAKSKLKEGGTLMFTFHSSDNASWIAMKNAVERAGFYITECIAVNGEGPQNFKRWSNLDCFFVCKRQEDIDYEPKGEYTDEELNNVILDMLRWTCARTPSDVKRSRIRFGRDVFVLLAARGMETDLNNDSLLQYLRKSKRSIKQLIERYSDLLILQPSFDF